MIPTRFLVVSFAAAIAVTASPFPVDIAANVAKPTGTPFYGQLKGNHQPAKPTPSQSVTVFATGGTVTDPNLAVVTINNNDGIGPGNDEYRLYTGDGTTGAGWPDKSAWVSYVDMFNNNKPEMFTSCEQYSQPNDSGPEVGAIYDAIETVAKDTKVDHRFILAVIMQESGGCVRVPTSNFGVRNPGLMQDHNGKATCNDEGRVRNPCPTGVITLMVREGTAGTEDGDGLAQTLNQAGGSDVSAFYRAARLYNSGSIDRSGDLGKGIATHCYSSDIANRLTGWVQARHDCPLDGRSITTGQLATNISVT